MTKFLIALLSVAIQCETACAEPFTRACRPNFLVFIADDLNKEYFDCYGNEQTAALTASHLAAEGMVFDNAFTGQAICAPSRSMLYTGKYPLRNGSFINHSRVYQGTQSVCHYLGDASYDVILCGKSHVGPDDAFPWTIAMDSVESAGDSAMFTRPALPVEKLENYFSTRGDSKNNPFCIIASSYYPHGEHPRSSNFTADTVSVTRFQEDNRRTRESEARFSQAVQNCDDELAQVLSILEKYKLANDTLVLFVSDHGRFGKWTAYDKGLNVPFMVRWPGVIKPGSRSNALVSFADVLPTMLELAGVKPVEGLDGRSFLPVLKGVETGHQDYLFGVTTNQGIIDAHVFPGRMIRSINYKYIRNYNALEVVLRKQQSGQNLSPFLELGAKRHPDTPEEELYDLVDDPNEQRNLAPDPSYAGVMTELRNRLQDWLVSQNDFLKEPGKMPLLATSKAFRLDRKHPRQKSVLPPGLINSLDSSDLYQHSP